MGLRVGSLERQEIFMSAALDTPAAADRALDLYLDGLKNAHALEKQAVQLLERQLERIEIYPEVSSLLNRHLQETRGQIARLDEILSSFGEESSLFKDMTTALAGNLAAIGHAFSGDEVLKNHFANHAFENYEIAAYLSLIELAEQSGRGGHVSALRQTLAEERNAAQALHDLTGDLTRKYAALYAAGEKADR
jgi:ferritin-like metal-binding protein YciE